MQKAIAAGAALLMLGGVALADPFGDALAANAHEDYASAFPLFMACAVAENPYTSLCEAFVGAYYELGQGTPQDYSEAMRWYRKAADRGLASAQTSIGMMYNYGNGVPIDYAEAARWYRKAADQGESRAQRDLGNMYSVGHGVLRDYVKAHMWLNLAAAQGAPDAAANRDYLAKLMTRAQLAEAQLLAREWKPSK
jgi:uncharacterized protein